VEIIKDIFNYLKITKLGKNTLLYKKSIANTFLELYLLGTILTIRATFKKELQLAENKNREDKTINSKMFNINYPKFLK